MTGPQQPPAQGGGAPDQSLPGSGRSDVGEGVVRPDPYGAPVDPRSLYGAQQYPPPPQYPPPGHLQQQYGAPQYGQPPYGQPQYGAHPYAEHPGGPPRRNRAALIWSLVGGAVIVAVLLAAVVVVVSGSTPDRAPAATAQPDGLGFDPTLNRLARQCFDGTMDACDELFDDSDPGSDYEEYGDTCAGRKPAGQDEYCVDVFADS